MTNAEDKKLPDVIGIEKFLDELIKLEEAHNVQLGFPAGGGFLVQRRKNVGIGMLFNYDALLGKYIAKDKNGQDMSVAEIERNIGRYFYQHVVKQSSERPEDKAIAKQIMDTKVKPFIDRMSQYIEEHEKSIAEISTTD